MLEELAPLCLCVDARERELSESESVGDVRGRSGSRRLLGGCEVAGGECGE
jgi:hypothetical protein